jgi:hypothetical protein
MGACFRYLFINGAGSSGAFKLVDRSAHADNPRFQTESGTHFNPLPSHMV